VHAEAPAVFIAVRLDGRELVSGDLLFSGNLIVVWETPSFRASSFTGPTTYAEGAIIQNGFGHIETLNSFLPETSANV
jgi:hypothetical protein